MKQKKGLVILHIDGVSFSALKKAIREGHMKFTKSLVEGQGYEILRYRCGIPSTTPYCQAGILYGDNYNIPSFRWYDKTSGIDVRFGINATFSYVAHKYFARTKPLVLGGASISACYPAGAKETFGLSYKDRQFRKYVKHESKTLPLIVRWLRNPIHIIDWLWHTFLAIGKTIRESIRAKIKGHPIAIKYVLSGLLEEIFAHHLTRYATGLAMKQGLPAIYSCIYAYDETAHAFGPQDGFCDRMLGEVDRTIEYIAKRRLKKKNGKLEYELVLLSDHGQIPTKPLVKVTKKKLSEVIGEVMPTFVVDDGYAQVHNDGYAVDGHIKIINSGGIAHLYFTDITHRLSVDELQIRFPKLIRVLSASSHISFVMINDKNEAVLFSERLQLRLNGKHMDDKTKKFLSQFDDEPEILAKQLYKLNSFTKSGDIILFGSYKNGKQINFEVQSGGHGAIGGEQMHPFLFVKKAWDIDTSSITDATQIHKVLSKLRKSL